MLRYSVVLVSLNFLLLVLGLPVQDNTSLIQGTLSNELMSLSNSCENVFLAESVRSKLQYCNISVPKYKQTDLECIMFYEINYQLCAALGRSTIDLQQSFTKYMNGTQDVMTLCNDAKSWKSATPKYKTVLDKIFSTRAACVKVCTVDDLLSEDANFFCKYFKWGSGILSQFVNPVNKVQNTNAEKPIATSDISTATSNVVPSQNSNADLQHKDQPATSAKVETAKVDNLQETTRKTLPKVSLSTQETDVIKPVNIGEKVQPNTLTSKSEPIVPVEEQPTLKEDVKESKQNDLKPPVENTKQKLDPELDDDPDTEFGNDLDPDDEPLSDQDNLNDANGLLDADPKIDKEPLKENSNINKLPLTSFNVDTPQREIIYPNSIQDTFADDDDHFFPFFLTTIVFVVLLYILYHNKSKVTKLILGIIVEGRQTNRRRNSRGHAYRRLDTLEQAMSTNSTAPPSKIIY
ncbi:unnamed protein product [Leptosia nina]|uniref:Uncharacterized protein n=1 Tax=Leptosia nina TaxID=320188 RepID=A0AAV1J6J8_9NEOP